MKKFIGYGVFCLVGLLCVYCMMLRVESLDNKKVSEIDNNVYTLNENK